MEALAHLRHLIAALDTALADALCARARFHLHTDGYGPLAPVPGGASGLAAAFAEATTPAGRVRVLRPAYVHDLLPMLCTAGTDADPTPCLSADAACLDALARRLSLSVHVATRKREALPEALQEAIRSGNPDRVEDVITNRAVEDHVMGRIRARALEQGASGDVPDRLVRLYNDWIIPLSRRIQVHGLLLAEVPGR